MKNRADEPFSDAPVSTSLGKETRLRSELRELQWQLPLPVQSMLLRLLGRRYDPYSDWHREKRAIFLHIPRTAGTSFTRAAGAPKQHLPMARYAVWDRAAFRDYFKFCFVRNPWDRLLSAFSIMNEAKTNAGWPNGQLWARRHLRDYPDFETFVLALGNPKVRRAMMLFWSFRPQIDWLTLPRSAKICADFVGRFESLDEDFPEIAKRLGLDQTLPIMNASSHPPYRDAYSQKMRGIVDDLYGNDIRLFDYKF